MDKKNYLAALHQSWSGCRGCNLCHERKNVVFGFGNPDAQIMIIGEAPGEQEDLEGYPFIGASGRLLDHYLGQVSARQEVIDADVEMTKCRKSDNELRRAHVTLRTLLLQEFYYTNVVMCRPPENRDPIPKEIEACRARLLEEIYMVDPVLIITAGSIATQALTGKKISITQKAGEFFDVELPGRGAPYQVTVMAMLHPSYLLRKNDFKQKDGDTVKTYANLLQAMRIIDEHNRYHYGTPRPALRPKT